jgi:hypothetical protein
MGKRIVRHVIPEEVERIGGCGLFFPFLTEKVNGLALDELLCESCCYRDGITGKSAGAIVVVKNHYEVTCHYHSCLKHNAQHTATRPAF